MRNATRPQEKHNKRGEEEAPIFYFDFSPIFELIRPTRQDKTDIHGHREFIPTQVRGDV